MAHITFIHGIANKPDSENLLSLWKSNLADGGLDLDAYSIGSSMVYWADVVYADPAESSNEFESVESELGTAAEDDNLAWLSDLPNDQKAFAESLITRWGLDVPAPGGNERVSPDQLPDEESSYSFEAIPLPWFIKKRVIKRLLKDVHHYLFNETFSPREGDTYQVQTEIRNRFVEQLIKDKTSTEGKHVVVAHSMGTVISYDCLKNVQRCPSIDGYMTLGSPLGLSEIHDNFSPAYEKSESFPSEKVNGGWVNVYDRLDPVAFDARIANDYKENGQEVVIDERVRNSGVWRHSADKYFSQEALCEHLRTLLDL